MNLYDNVPYLNSAAYRAVMNATTQEQLKNRRRYTIMAIEFHKQENNPGQVQFFESDLELIDKRLEKMKTEEPQK